MLLYLVSKCSEQHGPRSDCSSRSSLIWCNTVRMQVEMTCIRLLKRAEMQMKTSVAGFICCWQPCNVLTSISTVFVCYNVVRGVSSSTNFDYTTNRHEMMHTVVPTKSDSYVILCLQLLSQTLTCTLHLS